MERARKKCRRLLFCAFQRRERGHFPLVWRDSFFREEEEEEEEEEKRRSGLRRFTCPGLQCCSELDVVAAVVVAVVVGKMCS